MKGDACLEVGLIVTSLEVVVEVACHCRWAYH